MKQRIIPILSFFLSILACTNPFTTRDAETPDLQENVTTPTRPLAYDEVVYFLQKAINEKNVVNYLNCFLDESFPIPPSSYQFIHDRRIPQESFANWSLEDESSYLNNLINSPGKNPPELLLNFFNTNFTYTPLADNWNDSILVAPFKYELRINYRDTAEVYLGISRIKLIANDKAQWAIFYWEDRQDEASNSMSWTYLKAARRNR